jgi:hypothetical protein
VIRHDGFEFTGTETFSQSQQFLKALVAELRRLMQTLPSQWGRSAICIDSAPGNLDFVHVIAGERIRVEQQAFTRDWPAQMAPCTR